ncbi:MAG: hypothetical protein HC829_08835, partial [Bacteroidales bacterium]|nr:hypothetical protein [Bacteroidales bacterium]
PTLQNELAQAYLQWGQSIVSSSDSDPALLSNALDKFLLGVAIPAEESAVYASLQWEQKGVQNYLQGLLDMQELQKLRDDEAAIQVQQETAGRILERFGEAYAEHPNLPGLQTSYISALNMAAQVAEKRGEYRGRARGSQNLLGKGYRVV